MKQSILRIAIFLVVLLSFIPLYSPQPVEAVPSYTVDGNKVYAGNSEYFIQAEPATLTASGWVEVTIKTTNYSGEIDLIYGFNSIDNVQPLRQEFYESYEHTLYNNVEVTKTETLTPSKVINLSPTTKDLAIFPTVDKSLNFNVAIVEVPNVMLGTINTRQIAFAYDITDGKSFTYKYKTIEAQPYKSTFEDWNKVDSAPTETVKSYAGVTKYKEIKSQRTITANTFYRTRVWIDIPFNGTNIVSGKYNIGIKPSALTLDQAISQNKLWLLDPWYNASWLYRKSITVTNASADYQTKVLIGKTSGATGEEVDCGGYCQDDFDDLRFAAANGTTLLDYWVESVAASGTSFLATVWVQNNATPDTTLYMYYGNAGAATVSSGANTFIVFDDFERGVDGDTVGGSWTEGNAHCHISTENEYTGIAVNTRSMKLVGASALVPYATIPVTKSDSLAIRYRVYKETAAYTVTAHGDGANNLYCQTTTAEVVQVYDGAGYVAAGSITADAWQLMEFDNFVWGSLTVDVWENEVKGKDNADISYANTTYTNQVGIQGTQVTGDDVWIDDFIVRKWAATEPTFAWGSETVPSCTLTGTVTAAITEANIVTGSKTIILTLSPGSWVAAGATFDAQRQNIINGLDSAQAEGTGWDAEVKAKEVVGAVVRTSDTIVTITLTAEAGYNITAQETITATIPASAIDSALIIASPTFTIDVAPTLTVVTNAATNKEATTATLNGEVTDAGGETIDYYGFVWDTGADQGNPGNVDPSTPAGTWDFGWKSGGGNYGANPFSRAITGLPEGTTIYFRAAAHGNVSGWYYGASANFLTKPAAPTNVAATDGTDTAKVVITWTKSTGATDYHVWRDAVDLGAAGDVATFDDAGAAAGVITPGTASATDGTSGTIITLSVAGESVANGTTHTYKVVASNATGNSADSLTNTGYRGVGAITYAWYRSAADSDVAYGVIGGATTDPYDDTGAPDPVITPGTATASDGISTLHVVLTIAGNSVADGIGRWYYCILSATGTANADTTHNRGYQGAQAMTYAWQRSAADSDAAYGSIVGEGGTTNPYNDTNGVVDPDGRWYYCIVSSTGAANADTDHNRGYKSAADPPDVTTLPCAGFTANTAIVNGIMVDDDIAACTSWGFDYGLTNAYGSSVSVTQTLADGAHFSYNLIGLTPATVYHYRAKAYSTEGWGYGADATFSTSGSASQYECLNTGGDANGADIYGANWAYQTFTTSTAHTAGSVWLYIQRTGANPGTITVSLRRVSGNREPAGSAVYTADATTNATTIVDAGLASAVNDYYTGCSVYNVTRALWGTVTGYVGATHTITCSSITGQVVTDTFYLTGVGIPTGADLGTATYAGASFAVAHSWYEFTFAAPIYLEASTQYAIVVRAITGDNAQDLQWRWDAGGGFIGGNAGHSVDSGSSWVTDAPADQLFCVWGYSAIEIQDVKVLQSYSATDDWLIVVRYNNQYPPYYDTYDVKRYFAIQFVDASANLLAQVALPQWGNRIGSIYLSSTTASSLTVGGDYRVRIYGTFTGNPYVEYAIQSEDWLGDDLTRLDSWIISSASVIGTYYSKTFTVYIAGRGEVLNAEGGTLMLNGIGNLSTIRPGLFQTYTVPGTIPSGTFTQAGQAALGTWQSNIGADGTVMITRLANIVGTDGGSLLSIIWLIATFAIMAFGFTPGHTTPALILSLVILIGAVPFGVSLVVMSIITLIAAFLFVKRMWIDTGA